MSKEFQTALTICSYLTSESFSRYEQEETLNIVKKILKFQTNKELEEQELPEEVQENEQKTITDQQPKRRGRPPKNPVIQQAIVEPTKGELESKPELEPAQETELNPPDESTKEEQKPKPESEPIKEVEPSENEMFKWVFDQNCIEHKKEIKEALNFLDFSQQNTKDVARVIASDLNGKEINGDVKPIVLDMYYKMENKEESLGW